MDSEKARYKSLARAKKIIAFIGVILIIAIIAGSFSLTETGIRLTPSPVSASDEVLMTRYYFDQWVTKAVAPIEEKIKQKEAEIAWLKAEIAAIKRVLINEIILKLDETQALVDGTVMALDVPPLLIDDRTFVPVRFIGENLGAQVQWSPELRRVTYLKGSLTIQLFVDQAHAVVNNEIVDLGTPPIILEGRTMVPLRFVAELMGASVAWDGTIREIMIRV